MKRRAHSRFELEIGALLDDCHFDHATGIEAIEGHARACRDYRVMR